MPIIPKNSKIKVILFILCFLIIFLAFYFRAQSVRAPIIVDIAGGLDHVATTTVSMAGINSDTDQLATTTATSTPKTKGAYKAFSDSAVTNAKGGVHVVLFFNALWSPDCQAADRELLSETIPDDLLILNVDYDSSATMKEKYGVTSPDSFVEVNQKGEQIQKWEGGGLDKIVTMTNVLPQ